MKLSLKKILNELVPGPGLRPEGPSTANQHLFPHHGLYSKTGGGKPKASNKSPYEDADGDLKLGDQAAEETDLEIEKLPIESLFKFTQSANDNTSFHRPPTYGAGAMGAYGKDTNSIDSYDPDDEKDNEERQQTLKGRADQKAKLFENPGLRQRHPRDDNDYITKQPWSQGMPGFDKKDIESGEAKVDELMKDRSEDSDAGKIYNKIVGESYADSDFSKVKMQKVHRMPKSDLNFWDIIDRENIYLITDPDKDEDEKEKEETTSKY